jgi:hypothetical protein
VGGACSMPWWKGPPAKFRRRSCGSIKQLAQESIMVGFRMHSRRVGIIKGFSMRRQKFSCVCSFAIQIWRHRAVRCETVFHMNTTARDNDWLPWDDASCGKSQGNTYHTGNTWNEKSSQKILPTFQFYFPSGNWFLSPLLLCFLDLSSNGRILSVDLREDVRFDWKWQKAYC